MKENSIKIDIYGLEITITSNDIHIKDSYRVTSRKDMKKVFSALREYLDDYHITMDNPLYHRSVCSLCNEWVAHNNAYKLGYKRERTKSIDLNYPQAWYALIIYWFGSLIVL